MDDVQRALFMPCTGEEAGERSCVAEGSAVSLVFKVVFFGLMPMVQPRS